MKPTPAALDNLMTPEQSAIVWDATMEAAKNMERLGPKLTPRPFEQRQVDADATKMVRRFLTKNLDSKIPPLEKTQDAAAVVVEKIKRAEVQARKRVPPVPPFKPKIPVDRIPKPIVPRRPKVNWGLLLLLAAVAMSGES